MANKKLAAAKDAKKDEFYTQYEDIQSEVNAYLEYNPDTFLDKVVLLPCDDPEWSNFTRFFAQNFEALGLKKLISTSFAANAKKEKYGYEEHGDWQQLTIFEMMSPQYDTSITMSRGKIFTLTRDMHSSGAADIDDLEWHYLEGDGDFRSDEVKALRDEADIIVTNPPFSLFTEFLPWVVEAEKQFLVIGSLNAITYKEVFLLLRANKIWLGKGFKGMAGHFINKYYTDYATAGDHKDGMIRVSGVIWFTNIEHGRHHKPLELMTMADNKKFSKHKEIRGHEYMKYVTFDGIDVPFTDAIPRDYPGIMGVPKSFMEQHCPEQFEILGYEREDENIQVGITNMPESFLAEYRNQGGRGHYTKGMKMLCLFTDEGKAKITFSRILIRYTQQWIDEHPEDFAEKRDNQ